jgi:hypothetical protein
MGSLAKDHVHLHELVDMAEVVLRCLEQAARDHIRDDAKVAEFVRLSAAGVPDRIIPDDEETTLAGQLETCHAIVLDAIQDDNGPDFREIDRRVRSYLNKFWALHYHREKQYLDRAATITLAYRVGFPRPGDSNQSMSEARKYLGRVLHNKVVDDALLLIGAELQAMEEAA